MFLQRDIVNNSNKLGKVPYGLPRNKQPCSFVCVENHPYGDASPNWVVNFCGILKKASTEARVQSAESRAQSRELVAYMFLFAIA